MARIIYFNPENDLALAVGRENYTPPRAAIALRESGALLPLWLGDEGDYALVTPALLPQAEALRERFNLGPKPVGSLRGLEGDFAPWGWSPHSAATYRQNGLSPELIPQPEELKALRSASHRYSSVIINRLLRPDGSDSTRPRIATTPKQAIDMIYEEHQHCILKSPWSSSGRGVIDASKTPKPTLQSFILGTLSRQHSIMIERKLDRIADFAMLFEVDGNFHVEHIGLSLFQTAEGSGAYTGNVVATERFIARRLRELCPSIDIMRLATSSAAALQQVLKKWNCHYRGPAGIDMLIHRSPETGLPVVAPCVELNLRCTMGILAHHIASHLQADAPMRLVVAPRASVEASPLHIAINGIDNSPFSIHLAPLTVDLES